MLFNLVKRITGIRVAMIIIKPPIVGVPAFEIDLQGQVLLPFHLLVGFLKS